ncbi:hypothetical protein ACFYYR_29090 [Streptomyces sp. NPDC001922]|uniref:hypothetical protein n=1 Tax=Streptomyces sp. NPDC001922 TaxID=3364624 RepID=UPI00367E83FC
MGIVNGRARTAGSDPDTWDVALLASVRARRLRFGAVPDVEVRFHGSPDRASVSRSVRSRLPDRVGTAVDYRDLRIDSVVASRLTDDSAEEPPRRPPRAARRTPQPPPSPRPARRPARPPRPARRALPPVRRTGHRS